MEERLVPYALTGYQWANVNVSASYLPDGTQSEGYSSNLFDELKANPTATWQREFARALQSWANVSTLNFRFVSDNGSPSGTSGSMQGDSRWGDIRLGAHPLNGYIGYTYYPSNVYTLGGDITLNPDYTFYIGSHPDLYSVLVHEAGHAIGLGHSTEGTVMYQYITGVYSGLTADDIAGVQAIYGARQPDAFDAAAVNESMSSSASLGLDSSGATTVNADLTTQKDVDTYSVVAPLNTNGNLTVTVDARNLSLLAPKVSIYNSAGVLIGSVSATTYGSVATVNLTGLTPGQTYYVEADGATSDEFGMGAYTLQVQFGGVTPPPPTYTPDRYEPNDGMGTAKDFGKTNSVAQTGLTVHNTDLDYYSFTAKFTAPFKVSSLFTASKGNLDLVVYDATQTVLATGTSGGDNEVVTFNATVDKKYYIKVYGTNGAQNNYDLQIAKSGTTSGGTGGGTCRGKKCGGGAHADELGDGSVLAEDAPAHAEDPHGGHGSESSGSNAAWLSDLNPLPSTGRTAEASLHARTEVPSQGMVDAGLSDGSELAPAQRLQALNALFDGETEGDTDTDGLTSAEWELIALGLV